MRHVLKLIRLAVASLKASPRSPSEDLLRDLRREALSLAAEADKILKERGDD